MHNAMAMLRKRFIKGIPICAQARVQVNFAEGSKWLMMGYAKLEAI
jgi:hypothetical protein